MISMLYRGSVKDLKGPVRARMTQAVNGNVNGNLVDALVFEYTDSYSVFDWGKMPDAIPRKGEALAILAADWFEKLEKPEIWKEFSRTSEALALRKGNRFGSSFNEVGEELQARGLRTHFLGALAVADAEEVRPVQLQDLQTPVKNIAVRRVSAVKPSFTTVLGRALPDYHPTRNAPLPRLVPLEVIFRFSLPEGSSLLERVSRDPGYMASLGFGDTKIQPGAKFDFPIVELFTKLESTDRPVPLTEGLSISGLSATQLQDLLFRTAWVSGALRWFCSRVGLELADGKLEWGIAEDGSCMLVDAIGPDELRILKDGFQLSKEFLRNHYRETAWYDTVLKAKEAARVQGSADWKRGVPLAPPVLPPAKRELASQVYLSLTNALTGRNWFGDAWGMEKVLAELKKLD